MPKTRINCPNCRQPIQAEVEQVFDVASDPDAKQRLLSGGANLIQCPSCGYQGIMPLPIVYHDPQKELLLTFVPPEMGLPMHDQERIIGPLINKVINSLSQDKRKAYLLRPQPALTFQGLIERVLEADGITKEMIQAQQKRLSLIQRLANITTDDVLAEIARQEDKLIDGEFFTLLARLFESAMAAKDQESARRLSELQKKLLSMTTFGREIQLQSTEVQSAVQALQALGDKLTREKLLDLIVQAPTMLRVNAYVSLARPGLDYEFFQMLSDRIAHVSGAEKERLTNLREQILAMTREYDQQMQARTEQAHQALEALLESPDISAAAAQVLPGMDDFFLHALGDELEAARKQGNLDRSARLQKIVDVVQQAQQSPEEVGLIEELLDIPEQDLQAHLQAHRQEITPAFLEMLTSVVAQSEGDPALNDRAQKLFELALQISMESNL